MNRGNERSAYVLPAAAVALIVAYLGVAYRSGSIAANRFAVPALAIAALPLLWSTTRQALRGQFATDAIASIAIVTSLAMREPLPGLIIVLMQSGGEALERAAQRRASRALRSLEDAAPRIARKWNGISAEEINLADVRPGDTLIVPPGEIVPVDGRVTGGESDLNTATITGEPLPLNVKPGSAVCSGYINGRSPLIINATARAADSQYERIVSLVRSAQEHKAPMQRMADRYAIWFTPAVVAAALMTFAITHNMERVLALLVIATPCPLIIAAPVAFIGGINAAARSRILFRNGAAIESLAAITAAVLDKTGTLTIGRPAVAGIVSVGATSPEELLPLVAGIETMSGHTLAREVVRYAREQGVAPRTVSHVDEDSGHGIEGVVEHRKRDVTIAVGSGSFIAKHIRSPLPDIALPGTELRSWIAMDRKPAGYVRFSDSARRGIPEMIAQLRADGVRHIEILSGDDERVVKEMARGLSVDAAHGHLRPEDKVQHVQRVRHAFGMTAMVGDGTNDAPALAAADVAVAVASHGGGIAAETADVILLADDPAYISEAMHIARRTIRIARDSILAGIALSAIGMVAAALGILGPVPSAALQEVIDVAVILNALRAAAG